MQAILTPIDMKKKMECVNSYCLLKKGRLGHALPHNTSLIPGKERGKGIKKRNKKQLREGKRRKRVFGEGEDLSSTLKCGSFISKVCQHCLFTFFSVSLSI